MRIDEAIEWLDSLCMMDGMEDEPLQALQLGIEGLRRIKGLRRSGNESDILRLLPGESTVNASPLSSTNKGG